MIISVVETILGVVGIAEEDGTITSLYFSRYLVPETAVPGESKLLCEAFRQLQAYLAGHLTVFDLPLNPFGTPFMKEVWRHVSAVPYGSTVSYRDIALKVGNPKAARAVGMASRRNPLPVFIPCHRIIGSDGKLTGYRGGLQLKQRLLDLEKCEFFRS